MKKLKAFWERLYEPIPLYCLGRLSDIFSTAVGVEVCGIEKELNARLREAMRRHGVFKGLALGELETLPYILPLVGFYLIESFWRKKKGIKGRSLVGGMLDTVGILSLTTAAMNLSVYMHKAHGMNFLLGSIASSILLSPLWVGYLKRWKERVESLYRFFERRRN